MVTILSESISTEAEKLENLKFLIQNTPLNISKVNSNGYAVSHISAHFGYIQILDYLLKNTNLSINQRDFSDNTPILQALMSQRLAENEKFEVIQFFLQFGDELDFNIFQNKTGGNLLYTCFLLGYFDICDHFLIHTKMDINVQNYFGNSNLYALVSSGREEEEKLEYLKQIVDIYRANVFLLNKRGENILHLTATLGHRNILTYLINDQNMNVNQQDSFGNSPLMYALFQNNTMEKKTEMQVLNVVKDLVEIHGANHRLKNFEERSPLFLSFDQNYYKISEYLVGCGKMMYSKDDSFHFLLNRSTETILEKTPTLNILDTLVQNLENLSNLLQTGNTFLESMNSTVQDTNALLQEHTTKIDNL